MAARRWARRSFCAGHNATMIETSAPPRFAFNLPPHSSSRPRRLRTAWISDVHLGTRVIYIPGNHDEMISSFYGAYGNIAIQKHAIHRTADGRRILVIHGHELDTVVQNVKWLAFVGDAGCQFSLSLNPLINFIRRRFGRGYWSLSAYVKQRVKDAVSFIGKLEAAVVKYAERYHVDAVLCGHIHSASIREFWSVTYYNCGDWVE